MLICTTTSYGGGGECVCACVRARARALGGCSKRDNKRKSQRRTNSRLGISLTRVALIQRVDSMFINKLSVRAYSESGASYWPQTDRG